MMMVTRRRDRRLDVGEEYGDCRGMEGMAGKKREAETNRISIRCVCPYLRVCMWLWFIVIHLPVFFPC